MNKKRKNCFLAACKIWDRNVDLNEIDQKFPHGGRIGYGNSSLDFFLDRSKIFRLHAILHDSAGAQKQQQAKDQVMVTCCSNYSSPVF